MALELLSSLGDLNKSQWAWMMYDLGSFGFATATITTMMPIFFKDGPAASLSPHHATALWGYALGSASLIGAFLAPVVGAFADAKSCRRLLVAIAVASASTCSVLFSYSQGVGVIVSVCLVAATAVFYQLSISLYSSLLPCLFSREQAHQVSPIGTAFSQLGGGVMIVMVYLIHHHQSQSLTPKTVQTVVIGAVLWWSFFVGILMYYIPEPKISRIEETPETRKAGTLERLANTWVRLQDYKDLMRFITAGFFIGEGSGVIFHMSVIYAVTVCNINYTTVLAATILSRFTGVFFAINWGVAVQKQYFGPQTPRKCYMAVIAVLILACIMCATLYKPWQYWVLATMLSCAGTGAFAFSRSLLASLCPPDKAAEIFGYSAMIGHVAGFVGPLLFASIVHVTQTPRSGFVVVLLFLMLGASLFVTTDFERGEALANALPYANLSDAKETDEEQQALVLAPELNEDIEEAPITVRS